MNEEFAIEWLRKLLAGEVAPTCLTVGACWNLAAAYAYPRGACLATEIAAMQWVAEASKACPSYSGDELHPVPGCEQEFMHHAQNELDMWDRSTTYGRARWQLLREIYEAKTK